uniref:Uncharacterized protein n=1 Tax=viral metagenome TaxID=1070528 RepID=A0A6C0IRJ6_9ZZZZ
MNKKTGFTETLVLPQIQLKNTPPNGIINVCSSIQEQVTNTRRKTKYAIPSQFPKLL